MAAQLVRNAETSKDDTHCQSIESEYVSVCVYVGDSSLRRWQAGVFGEQTGTKLSHQDRSAS